MLPGNRRLQLCLHLKWRVNAFVKSISGPAQAGMDTVLQCGTHNDVARQHAFSAVASVLGGVRCALNRLTSGSCKQACVSMTGRTLCVHARRSHFSIQMQVQSVCISFGSRQESVFGT